ncbi:hypothetical protein [Streptomyces sp. NBC_00996]|uniref:hypothetical protein n=1 Tax=Streptomyces sp. NBC_00996 TaxID=2903710 RepID=UPI00386A20B8|nr:hypothetical protein OG390_04490 [Streptomyces sp. NBC_00996]
MSTGISDGRERSSRPRWFAVLLAMVACGAVLVSCSTDNDKQSGASPVSPRPTPPNTSNFTGTPPSALSSAASSINGSARASASAAASSASAAASAFEASVSADTARASAAAEKELKDVKGSGNALSEVGMTGLPRAETGGLLAVLVTITNKTDHKASYAVQIDFKNSDGKVVETRFVGAQNLEPGKRAQPIAISRQPTEPVLTPRLTKAQRY